MSEKVRRTFHSLLSLVLNNFLRRLPHSPSRILECLGLKASDTVIDFGCGKGFFTIPFAKKARRVIAIDIRAAALEKAEKYVAKSKVEVEFFQNNGKNIPLPNSIADLIFLRHVYHELDDRQAVLKELARLLKPNGRLAIMEKTEKKLTPIGPPVVPVSEIETAIQNVGLKVSEKIRVGNETIVIGKRDAHNEE
ncbi:class I SAM-dependent methyltransferase [Candidatus Bathyarchaeota archaeon]|nr:class I SAM-dependent methyltransferase [Candidatus Bathyarchaeota archaeon]